MCKCVGATKSEGYTNKKRFYSDEATGAFFTPEEAALERAKSAKKIVRPDSIYFTEGRCKG